MESAISPVNKLALTPKEAAQLSPFGENRIRELCRSDTTFPAFKNGKDFVIPKRAFEEWLARQAEYRMGLKQPLRRLAQK